MFYSGDLIEDLRRGGLLPEDTLLVHSSMKSIGEVDGGVDTVLDVFCNYFGAKGLIVFPSMTYSSVNAEQPEYRPDQTPCCVGLLPERFRLRPGVVRSWHPTHALAAFGPDAADFVAGHEQFDSPCARLSPWGRLADRHAKIMFLGLPNMCCNTFLHGVEEWGDVPDMLTEAHQPLAVHLPDGQVIPVPSRRHVGFHSTYYGKMEGLFREHQLIRDMKFGAADCRVLDAYGAMQLVLSLLKQDPLLFTHDRMPERA